MEIKFKTRAKNDKESYIQMYVNNNGNRYRFSTPHITKTKEWAKGYPKQIATTKNLRDKLDELKVNADKFISQTLSEKKRNPTQLELKEKINQLLGYNKAIDLKSIYRDYLEQKKQSVVNSTIQQIEVTFKLLFAFNNKVQLADIDSKFGSKFTTYLTKKGYDNVTTNKHHKNLKAFLNWAFVMDYTTQTLSKYFINKKTIEKTIIAITGEEREILETANLSTRLDRVRDLFLMCCYTGLRFSDVIRVNSEMIQGGEIHIIQQKTSAPVKIPVLTATQKILDKYNGIVPTISNQKANEYLKELFKELELHRLIFDAKQDKYVKLSDCITFHIGRKSFITLALSVGVNATIVQKISGHKKNNVFNSYIDFSSQIRVNELAKMDTHLTVISSKKKRA